MYIYEREKWPNFVWKQNQLADQLAHLRLQQGRLIGGMESIGYRWREEAIVQALTQDVVKSSEIEGEILDQSLVRSSVGRHLGIDVAGLNVIDKNIEGVVEMILDATQNFDQPVTAERLFSWHSLLFPSGCSSFTKVTVGGWRTGPVYVVSGHFGKETVHFEAPTAERVEGEMALFLEWLENDEEALDPIVKAAIAHLWFVTIHPFEDGNGRIGRAIADLLLARSEKNPYRFYSLSAQIQAERKEYYGMLEDTQKGSLDITAWLLWFLSCLDRALGVALSTLKMVVDKGQFWENMAGVDFNERQRKVLNRLLEGFEGKLTSSKWAKIAKCSQDTAYRDILDLMERGYLVKNKESGRSTSYSLVTHLTQSKQIINKL